MSGVVKIKLYCDTGFAGCSHIDYLEYDRDEWEALTDKEREEFLEEEAQIHMGNHIDYGACVVDREDE